MSNAYRLEVRLTIREVELDANGGYERYTANTLDVSDSVSLGRLDFRGLLEVMAGLHDAIKDIKPAEVPKA